MKEKHILLAVVGLSPAVITETLYALHCDGKDVSEIHIITTGSGKDSLVKTLLSPIDGVLHKFFVEYGIDPATVKCNSDTIHIIQDQTGKDINDIVRSEDNESLLKLCFEKTWALTKSPKARVYFLIAGGRKTMASCLTLAAQFYGRHGHDLLLHVLLSPPELERREVDFWFPLKSAELVSWTLKDGERTVYKHIKSSDIEINLVEIPLVSMREMLPDEMLIEPKPPEEMLAYLYNRKKPSLVISVPDRTISLGEVKAVKIQAITMFALYVFFARKRQRCSEKHGDGFCAKCLLHFDEGMKDSTSYFYHEENEAELMDIYNELKGYDKYSRKVELIKSYLPLTLRSEISKLKKEIVQKFFEPQIAKEIEIRSFGSQPKAYGINLGGSRIDLNW